MSHYPGLSSVSVCIPFFLFFLLFPLTLAADLPFIFGEDTPPLEGLSPQELQRLATSAPGLDEVPKISQVPEDEVMEFTEVGGKTVASGGTKSTAGELKTIFNDRVDVDERIVHDTALLLASDFPGTLSFDQICAIYEYLNSGDDSTGGWRYVPDHRGSDYYQYASQTLEIGKKKSVSGIGDCDDFAILMVSLVESVSGTTRIILAYNQSVGHAYAEVYLGNINEPEDQVEYVIEALKLRYSISEVFTHLDTNSGEVWLNLDWWPDRGVLHPGGPFFPGTKHIPLLIRSNYSKTHIRPPEGFQPRPKNATPDVGDSHIVEGYEIVKGRQKADETGLIMTLGTQYPSRYPGYCVAFSPADGRTLVSGREDGTIRVWNVETGRDIRMFDGAAGYVNSVAFSPDGQMFASGGRDGTIKLWDVGTGREIRTLTDPNCENLRSVAFSPDGRILASGSYAMNNPYNGSIRLWDVGTGRELKALTGHIIERMIPPGNVVECVAFSPNGLTLASCSIDGVMLWDVQTGRELQSVDWSSENVRSIAFSPDGQTLASGNSDGVMLWDVQTGRELKVLTGHSKHVYSIAFSPDGQTLASGNFDGTIKLWDVGTARELKTLTGHSDFVDSVTFSPDGQMLASGSRDGTIKLWSAA